MNTTGVRRIGRYIVDLDRRRLLSNGTAIELGWRHFEALRLLVEADGRVVEREEFFRRVWQNTSIDESNLTKCIAQLRKVLNHGGDEDYLETVPRIGYRLAASIQSEGIQAEPVQTAQTEPVQTEPANAAAVGIAPVKARFGRRHWVAGAVFAVLLIGGTAWYVIPNRLRMARAEAMYEEGRRLRAQKNSQTLGSAIEAFRRAIDLNPRNAQYYGSLAEALTKVPGPPDPKLAVEVAEQGLRIDPRCGACNAVLGFVLFSRFHEWERAQRLLAAAIEINPKDAGSRGYYSMLLASQNRLEEALREVNNGLEMEPYHATLHAIKSSILYYLGRYPEASATAERAVSFGLEQGLAWRSRVYSNLLAGDPAAAVAAIAKSRLASYPGDAEAIFRAQGIRGVARRVIETVTPAWVRAHWRMVLDDTGGALDELETSHREREFDLIYVTVDPMFKPLRSEPRFCKIVQEMNLKLASCS